MRRSSYSVGAFETHGKSAFLVVGCRACDLANPLTLGVFYFGGKMRLWILEHINVSEFNYWQDIALGFVVCAETEDQARYLASNDFCGEEGEAFWLDEESSACRVLEPGEEPNVVMCSFRTCG
jgi:hypothetical protein